MTSELEVGLYIFLLAGFLGYHLITRIPPVLHTPLMSATNAIAGISLVGSLVVAGANYDPLSTTLGFIAVACSATNVVGGFLITDRMLGMFKSSSESGKRRRPEGLILLGGVVVVMLLMAAVVYAAKPASMGFEEYVRRHISGPALRFSYILSAALFVLGLKGLSSPRWARRGMWMAELGMFLAVVGTLFHPAIVTYRWIVLGFVIGAVCGGGMARWLPMTAVPQGTALSRALGTLAACLIGISEYVRFHGHLDRVTLTALDVEVIVGALAFTGSLMAAAKLQGLLPSRPMTYRGQNVSNLTLLAVIFVCAVYLVVLQHATLLFYVMTGLATLFGLLLVIPIGAADMPVVLALLNSYGGLADAMMGFVLMNKIQIITGSLDGTSGFLLSLLMCRAMNRSATSVLFGAFGQAAEQKGATDADAKGVVRSLAPDEAAVLFDTARSVIIVPGYGMAVAQAQHAVAEVASILAQRGCDVKYAIHPVAGRMPGHMNVLLAEANAPYDQLYEMEQVNAYFPEADIALVVGANDVTNPAAKTDKASPLYGMPILEVERARSIIVLKRSLRPGFAGVENDLYYNEKCMMLFGDAKESLSKIIGAMKSLL
jgi:proton-translocating NAD(P)+ transhydrogenase subunit beta